jgi:hypothetical protein
MIAAGVEPEAAKGLIKDGRRPGVGPVADDAGAGYDDVEIGAVLSDQ